MQLLVLLRSPCCCFHWLLLLFKLRWDAVAAVQWRHHPAAAELRPCLQALLAPAVRLWLSEATDQQMAKGPRLLVTPAAQTIHYAVCNKQTRSQP